MTTQAPQIGASDQTPPLLVLAPAPQKHLISLPHRSNLGDHPDSKIPAWVILALSVLFHITAVGCTISPALTMTYFLLANLYWQYKTRTHLSFLCVPALIP